MILILPHARNVQDIVDALSPAVLGDGTPRGVFIPLRVWWALNKKLKAEGREYPFGQGLPYGVLISPGWPANFIVMGLPVMPIVLRPPWDTYTRWRVGAYRDVDQLLRDQ